MLLFHENHFGVLFDDCIYPERAKNDIGKCVCVWVRVECEKQTKFYWKPFELHVRESTKTPNSHTTIDQIESGAWESERAKWIIKKSTRCSLYDKCALKIKRKPQFDVVTMQQQQQWRISQKLKCAMLSSWWLVLVEKRVSALLLTCCRRRSRFWRCIFINGKTSNRTQASESKKNCTQSRHIGIFAHCKAYARCIWDGVWGTVVVFSCSFFSVTLHVFFLWSACWYCHHRDFPKPNARHSVFDKMLSVFILEKLSCSTNKRYRR